MSLRKLSTQANLELNDASAELDKALARQQRTEPALQSVNVLHDDAMKVIIEQ